MPSTFTRNLGLEKIAPGEQNNSWGATSNANLDKLDAGVAWRLGPAVVVTSPRDTAILPVPADAQRIRVEFQGIAGPVATNLYARFSFDNAASFAAGSNDYYYAAHGFTNQGSALPYGGVSSALLMTPGALSPSNLAVFGDFDMDTTYRTSAWRVTGGLSDGELLIVSGGGYSGLGGVLTHVAFGLAGSTLTGGRFRLLSST